jgi:hypothetical protein
MLAQFHRFPLPPSPPLHTHTHTSRYHEKKKLEKPATSKTKQALFSYNSTQPNKAVETTFHLLQWSNHKLPQPHHFIWDQCGGYFICE